MTVFSVRWCNQGVRGHKGPALGVSAVAIALLARGTKRMNTMDSCEPGPWIPTGYFAPLFVERVNAELDRLAALPKNWDAQGANATDRQVIAAARRFIAVLPKNVAGIPAVVPMAKGNLQFEWHEGPRSLELEIESPELVHYLKWDSQDGVEEEGTYSISDVEQSVRLVRWFHRGVIRM
jgi:hypothetical protein